MRCSGPMIKAALITAMIFIGIYLLYAIYVLWKTYSIKSDDIKADYNGKFDKFDKNYEKKLIKAETERYRNLLATPP